MCYRVVIELFKLFEWSKVLTLYKSKSELSCKGCLRSEAYLVESYRVKLKKYLTCPMNSSEHIKGTLLSFFEPEEIEEWTDPYNSIHLKLLTIITYLIEIWASTLMLIFVSYETRGLFGHYRTVINQLLSFGYGAVSGI